MQVIVTARLGSLQLRNSELELLEVHQALGEHTTCRLEFIRDNATDVALADLLGEPLVVTVAAEDQEPVTIFEGDVGSGSQSHLLNYGSRFFLEGHSPSIALEYRNTAHFPASSLVDVAAKLGAKVKGSPKSRGKLHLVQAGESEFEFLRRIADEEGCFLWTIGRQVEARDGFVDRGSELSWGNSLLEVTARATPVNPGCKGSAHQVDEKKDHIFHGVRKAPQWLSGAPRLVSKLQQLAKRAGGGGDPHLLDAPARATKLAEVKVALERESERQMGGALLIEGVSIQVGLLAGDLVKIADPGVFKLPTTGTLGLIEVTHRFKDQHYTNRFLATPWKGFTNLVAPGRPVMAGPVTAEVLEVTGTKEADDGDKKKMGRLRVRFRWQDKQCEQWVRVATPHAGNGRGFLMLPEAGDEVLVDFEHGDPERPVVIGALWNGSDRPPLLDTESNDGANDWKRLVTRSGNTIQIRDTKDDELIEIHSAHGKCLIQLLNKGGGDKPTITIHSEGSLLIEAKEEIHLKSKRFTHEVTGDAEVSIGGKAARKVAGEDYAEAGKNFIVKAGQDLLLNGLNTSLKAGLIGEVVSGATTNIVGALVHIQPPGHVAKVAAPKTVPAPKAPKDVKREGPRPLRGVRHSTDPATPRK
jgi:uncharacterized protein involved in type VI secretion and phage assembly